MAPEIVPKWTLGMAVADVPPCLLESKKAEYTAQATLLNSPLVGEVVIVDNNPINQEIKDNAGKVVGRSTRLERVAAESGGLIRYVRMPTPKGVSPPKNRVFKEAKFPYVACIDAHVLLVPNFFESLEAAYASLGPDCPDLFHGPVLWRNRTIMATHLNDSWGSGMWGQWGVAWLAPDGKTLFSPHSFDGMKSVTYLTLPQDGRPQQPLTPDDVRALGLPSPLAWSWYEATLESAGCRRPPHNALFEIPGHGFGFFACRKDSWMPQPEAARGFGGEEMVSSVRYRKAGRRVWCVMGAKWWHDFDRLSPSGTQVMPPYRLHNWDKARNHYIAFKELGLDLAPLKKHFVPNIVYAHYWDQLVAGRNWPKEEASSRPDDMPPDEEVFVRQPTTARPSGIQWTVGEGQMRNGGCAGAARPPLEIKSMNVDAMYERAVTEGGPIQADVPNLRKWAEGCGTVLALHDGDFASTAVILAARPARARFVARFWQFDKDVMAKSFPSVEFVTADGQNLDPKLLDPEPDLVFIDTDPHVANRVLKELEFYGAKAKRRIVLHDSVIFGETAGNAPGVLPAVRGFLTNHPEFRPAAHHKAQHGLLVLSRDPKEHDEALYKELFADPNNKMLRSAPNRGVGSCTKKIIAEVGIVPDANCECNKRAAEMDINGVAWCKSHYWTCVGYIKDGLVSWGWASAFAKLAAHPVNTYQWSKKYGVSLTDPAPGLVSAAVKMAEEEEKTK